MSAAEDFDRAGWRGIGAEVKIVNDDGHDLDAFVAIGFDPDQKTPAISVWSDTGASHRREFAFWLTESGALKLAGALQGMVATSHDAQHEGPDAAS